MLRFYQVFLFLAFLVFTAHSQSKVEQGVKPVKIGLLISDKKSLAAKNGAELAVARANKNGGFNGRPFELVVHSMEGPWGTGAKEAVNLIFNDEVCAILGSTDGRNAHLVEQVTTKSRIVFLSAWSGDPTLSQAFVPWFYSCVPNNNQQASVLVEEICLKQNLNPIGIVADQEYDSQSALKSFLKKNKATGKPDPVLFSMTGSDQELTDLLNQLAKHDLKALVLLLKPANALKIMELLQAKNMNFPLFSTGSVLNENELTKEAFLAMQRRIRVTATAGEKSKQNAFGEEYQKQFGTIAGPVATYAYDGMNLLIESIKKAGLGREMIQKAMSEIRFEGISGLIQFDQKGNRSCSVAVLPLKPE